MGNLTDDTLLYRVLNKIPFLNVFAKSETFDPNGELTTVKVSGYLESLSSNTPLIAGEVFDTGIFDLQNYNFFGYEIFSDLNLEGAAFWYDDAEGTNVLRTFALNYNADLNLFTTEATRVTRYVRFVLTNNNFEDTTLFHFRFLLLNEAPAAPLVGANQNINLNARAQLQRAILAGLNADNQYQNVGVNDVGALNTSSFFLDVARERYPTYKVDTKFGRNVEVDIGTAPESVWNGGSLYTGFPDSASIVQVNSASSSDTAGGTGARIIELIGLDEEYNRQTEYVLLNGTTFVSSIKSYIRLSRVKVIEAGSIGKNAGQLTVRQVSNTAVVFAVVPTTGQSAICADTVPRGKTRYILQLGCEINRASGAAGSANAQFIIRNKGGARRAIRTLDVNTSSPYREVLIGAITLQEKTDMEWVINSVSDNNTSASAQFEYVDIDNRVEQLNNEASILFTSAKSQYLDFGFNNNLNLSTNVTVSAWFKASTGTSNKTIISKYGSTAALRSYFIELSGGTSKLRVYLYGTGNLVKDYSTVAGGFNDDQWHHIAFTFDGSAGLDALKIYVDGALASVDKTVDANATTIQSNSSNTIIGGLAFTPALNFFNGYIDSTAIFNKVLSSQEIEILYNNGSVLNINDSELEEFCNAWWRIGEDANFPLITDECSTNTGIARNFTGDEISIDIPSGE